MNKTTHTTLIIITFIIIPLLASKSKGDARAKIIKMYCDGGFHDNSTLFVENFVRATEITTTEMQSSHISTVAAGTGPNKNYLLTQCYSDLSSQDCMLCYAQIRTFFPGCFPQIGGRIYLDGCFMRLQNYSFFDEFTSPTDATVCGNATRKGVLFQESTRRAVVNAVAGALRNADYFAREEVLVSGTNDSVYVLAECWKTLSPSSCRACLENASTSITTCSPWSEGRVLNTGCFMRYSDTNFLNPVPTTTRYGHADISSRSSTKAEANQNTVSPSTDLAPGFHETQILLMISTAPHKHHRCRHEPEPLIDHRQRLNTEKQMTGPKTAAVNSRTPGSGLSFAILHPHLFSLSLSIGIFVIELGWPAGGHGRHHSCCPFFSL